MRKVSLLQERKISVMENTLASNRALRVVSGYQDKIQEHQIFVCILEIPGSGLDLPMDKEF